MDFFSRKKVFFNAIFNGIKVGQTKKTFCNSRVLSFFLLESDIIRASKVACLSLPAVPAEQ